METIFHEQQEGSLCAQHCLNALLQGQYFSPVDLADLAKQLDESERQQMAMAGEQSEEYKKFLKEPSNNLDDSGFFSIQVIDRALSVWGLGLTLFNSPDPTAVAARENPVHQKAYICNFRGHWLTIRKIGQQWFNLNSLLTGPELISNTYLSLFLKQLQEEGYSIFIVRGSLPECEADMLLQIAPVVQRVKPKLINENVSMSKDQADEEEEEEDQQLQRVLAESRQADEHGDQALQKALQLSMEGYVWEPEAGPSMVNAGSTNQETKTTSSTNASSSEPQSPSQEDIRQKRLAFLNKLESSKNSENTQPVQTTKDTTPSDSKKDARKDVKEEITNTSQNKEVNSVSEMSEEEMLRQAISMSMETGDK